MKQQSATQSYAVPARATIIATKLSKLVHLRISISNLRGASIDFTLADQMYGKKVPYWLQTALSIELGLERHYDET